MCPATLQKKMIQEQFYLQHTFTCTMLDGAELFWEHKGVLHIIRHVVIMLWLLILCIQQRPILICIFCNQKSWSVSKVSFSCLCLGPSADGCWSHECQKHPFKSHQITIVMMFTPQWSKVALPAGRCLLNRSAWYNFARSLICWWHAPRGSHFLLRFHI